MSNLAVAFSKRQHLKPVKLLEYDHMNFRRQSKSSVASSATVSSREANERVKEFNETHPPVTSSANEGPRIMQLDLNDCKNVTIGEQKQITNVFQKYVKEVKFEITNFKYLKTISYFIFNF